MAVKRRNRRNAKAAAAASRKFLRAASDDEVIAQEDKNTADNDTQTITPNSRARQNSATAELSFDWSDDYDGWSPLYGSKKWPRSGTDSHAKDSLGWDHWGNNWSIPSNRESSWGAWGNSCSIPSNRESGSRKWLQSGTDAFDFTEEPEHEESSPWKDFSPKQRGLDNHSKLPSVITPVASSSGIQLQISDSDEDPAHVRSPESIHPPVGALAEGTSLSGAGEIELRNFLEASGTFLDASDDLVPGTTRPNSAFKGGEFIHIFQLPSGLFGAITRLHISQLRKMISGQTTDDTSVLEAQLEAVENVEASGEGGAAIENKVTHPVYSYLPKVRPCYLLIFLGILTVVGSLAPALWRSSTLHDFSGGFTLAQYILGVGIFVVGSVTAIHSRSCTCWQSRPIIGAEGSEE